MTTAPLPPPDTHCFDDDTNMDVWSYSAPLVNQIVKQARADLEAENARLREALELALEYWQHRQQRYKNRYPIWVEAARAALKGET